VESGETVAIKKAGRVVVAQEALWSLHHILRSLSTNRRHAVWSA
jgi:hypothetical protein